MVVGEDQTSFRLLKGGADTVPFKDRRIRVRLAKPEDVNWVMTQMPGLRAFMETRIPPFPKDPAKFRPAIETLVTKHLFMVAETIFGNPVGFIAGFVSPGFFNPDVLVLQETLWWVEPGSRDGRAGLNLFEAFVAWGERYADWISITLEENSPIRKGHLEKHGFMLKERTYLREILRHD